MKALVAAMVGWIASVSDLPEPERPPSVARVPPGELAELARPPDSRLPHAGDTYVALYRPRDRTVVLRADWSRESLRDRSILLHELVHHMQREAGRRYPCRGAREAHAYALQHRWLQARGAGLLETLRINGLHLRTVTRCEAG